MINKDWPEVRLGDVMEIIGGGTPSTNTPEYWDGDISWLTPPDFTNATHWVDSSNKSITELGLKNSATKLLKKGDVIISARGTVGALAQLKKPMAFSQTSYGLRANPEFINNDFLFYILKFQIKKIKQFSYGTVFETITTTTFNQIDILLPPLPEQKAIAEVLSSLDDKIDLLHRQNKTLEDTAQTLFRKWFIEDANEGWEEKRSINDVVDFIKGKKPIRAKSVPFEGSMPQILIEAFDTGKTLYSETDRMSIANKKDILMVMDGARSGRVEIGFNGVVGSTIGIFRLKKHFNYPFFVF